MNNFVLASGSLRRQDLLKILVKEFSIIIPDVDESKNEIESPIDYVLRISNKKAYKVYNDLKEKADVLAADTIVVLDNEIITKPIDEKDLFKMLGKLSKKIHTVITGVTLIDLKGNIKSFYEETEVEFDEITIEEMKWYCSIEEGYDKAGGYAIQGQSSKFIKRINGCYYNVMGLPLNKLYNQLKNMNII